MKNELVKKNILGLRASNSIQAENDSRYRNTSW
jgi:hypothetical protein